MLNNVKMLAEEIIEVLRTGCNNLDYHFANNRISIFPYNSIGNPVDDISARPAIEIRIDKDNLKFIISWIYLVESRKGIGSELLNIFMNYCSKEGLKSIQIRGVSKDNISMNSFCKKHNFSSINECHEEYVNYEKNIIDFV